MQKKIISIDGNMCLVYGQISYDTDKIILEYLDEEGKIMKICDLKKYLKNTPDISHIG
jgi:hypothetical protein